MVEGYIDHNGFPVVMVTTTVLVNSSGESLDSLSHHLLRWARVAVSDGEKEVVLTGMVDKKYVPPYIYTTSRLKGASGKTYTLTVDYGDCHATAVTTIPQCPKVDSVRVSPAVQDSLCSVVLSFSQEGNKRAYYKAFVRRGRYGKQWLPSPLATVNGELIDGASHLVINRPDLITDTNHYSPYFSYSDTISIKFAQIDERAYRFWSDFDNHVNFSHNMLFPSFNNLRGNIDGGMGCWYGCGAVYGSFILANYRPRQ